MSTQAFVRQFAGIVTAVSAEVLSTIQAAELAIAQETVPDTSVSNIVAINFQYGHFKELVATMNSYEQDPTLKYKKYPLVYLVLDFPITKGNSGGYTGEVTLTIIIAYVTDKDLTAAQRFPKTFEPILYPIYNELLEQIAASPLSVVSDPKKIRHTQIDHPWWGSKGISDSTGNVLADTVDAIELENIQLTIDLSQCS